MLRIALMSASMFFLLLASALHAKEPSVKVIVSLVELLVNPVPYEGVRIQVMGYADDGINIQLYLTEDHANIRGYVSSIMIGDTGDGNIRYSDCLPGYVRIRGKFIKTIDNNYTITDVSSMYKPDGSVCWIKPEGNRD